ncbi:hypothetical protein [Sporomusa acidovorans]|uniref:Uncharacterized protein n=1 Tax=Sporomusa acidovorans (strain ATCC 49682 / DSM 3132 / Mol) TaxID=1123286 RepID=A0ABZ3J8E3_SPOA4|nr:hypothetical protein [Sporomusa acidovorans]OZC16049.1 hypothetical protein SPACI_44150 [Sporomusa acidovorans DSM 3132]SDD88364.1 hypothetical protein SAMN04488499_100582 [Sporomusa acidovorans]
MREHFIRIEVEDGEVEQIIQELYAAQEKIYQCYNRLISLGVVTVKPPAATDGPANQSSFSSSLTNE